MSTYDSIVTKLIAERQLVLEVQDKVELNQLRVSIYNKLQAHIKQWDDLGYLSDDLRDATVSSSVVKSKEDDSLVVTLVLTKRRKKPSFTILSTGTSEGTPDHATVSTDLEHDQSSTLQYGSANPDSQDYGTDTDSSGAQGESNGQLSAPEDWESVVRAFVKQNCDAQD